MHISDMVIWIILEQHFIMGNLMIWSVFCLERHVAFYIGHTFIERLNNIVAQYEVSLECEF